MQLINVYFFMFIVFLFITTIALAIFFAIWFSTGITKPVNKLASAATEVAEGNLLGKPVEIHSNDELQLLSNTFNDMRSNIHRLVQEIKDQSELDSLDRKSTRLNSSHVAISYAVFCLKKKKQ